MRTAVRPVRGRDVAEAGAATRRVSAPSWRDPRFLVGVVLVLAGVVAGARVVDQARDTVEVWALNRPVGAGQTLTAADLTVAEVHLDEATLATYVSARTPPGDVVALRGLAAGELLPRTSIGGADALTARPVTVPVAGSVPPGVAVGALVDVWVVPAPAPADLGGADARSAPERLVEAAEVSALVDGGGALSARSGADVQVVIPVGALPAVLQAVSAEDDLVLVPVPGSAAPGARS